MIEQRDVPFQAALLMRRHFPDTRRPRRNAMEIYGELITRSREKNGALASCKRGEELIIDRLPDKQIAKNRIRLIRQSGEIIGYLDATVGDKVISELDNNKPVKAEIAEITGGGIISKKTRRCTVKITTQSL
jgi:hypothetical protein